MPGRAWPGLVAAATFEQIRASAPQLLSAGNILKSSTAFFLRRGTSGAGREILSEEEIAGYHARTAALAPPDLLAWLHAPRQRG
ncbi:MAG: hypothetical protein LBI49_05490 [Nocardiopsaceae bacterium]|nr:hypothetical protein [Nocardiopsaceae bacterium]